MANPPFPDAVQYNLTLKNERLRYVNVIGLQLCLISAVIFFIQGLKPVKLNLIYLVACLLLVGVLVWNNFTSRGKKSSPIPYRPFLTVSAAIWFTMPFVPWLGLPILALALLEKEAKLPVLISFNHEQVVFHSLFKRTFDWSEFSNIMLKDSLLTIDFNNNRLIQTKVIDGEDPDEEKFNEFCRNRIIRRVTTKG